MTTTDTALHAADSFRSVGPVSIGDAGTAAEVEGAPAMLAVPQPDVMLDAGMYGPLAVRAASVRGAGHRYDGTPRQDDFCLGVGGETNEYLVAVVADGVSAGPSSHVASRAAVRFACKLLHTRLQAADPEDLDWNEIVGSVAGFVLAQARNESNDQTLDARGAARLMATTIAFAIVPVYANDDGVRLCTVVPVGDTSVWILRAGGRWESVTDIKNAGNAVAGSATAALPLLPATPVEARTAMLDAGDALFLMTDGVGDPLGDGTGEVGQVLASAWARPPDRYAFAAQVDFRRRSHTDDRTVIAVWPDVDTGEPAPPPPGVAPTTSTGFPTPAETFGVVTDPVPSESSVSSSIPAPDTLPGSEPGSPSEPWKPTPWTPTPWTPS